jgi:hypothetical protein
MAESQFPVSDDGRFWWDGQRWVATQRQQDRDHRTLAVVVSLVFGLPFLALLVVMVLLAIALGGLP